MRAELDRPLTSSLVPKTPSPKDVTLSPDCRLVDRATSNQYLFTLIGASFNDGGLPRARALQPEADEQLQKQLKAQQKQAARPTAAAHVRSSGG